MAKDLNRANLAERAHLPVAAGYTSWAATYDTDHNPLQAVDSIMLRRLLPEFLDLVGASHASSASITSPSSPPQQSQQQQAQFVDLGCGTGRNTAQLLAQLLCAATTGSPPPLKDGASVLAMDLTPAMLDVAAAKCTALLDAAADTDESARAKVHVHFRGFDMMAATPGDNSDNGDPPIPWGAADGVLSSLVIEHVPAAIFFRTCAALLRPGGLLLATNMHPDMGAATGSGYTDPATGGKVRIEGYNHTVQEFAAAAANAGLVLHGDSDSPLVAGPTEHMVREEESLQRRGTKWVGVNIWMGAVWRKA